MTTILETKNLEMKFGAVYAAKDINISIQAGEVMGVIGSNGAGKTTFVNMVTGYLKPTSGDIIYRGKSIVGRPTRDVTKLGICRSFQIPQLFPELPVIENMLIPIFAKRDGSFRMHALETVANESQIIDQAEQMLEEMNMADKRHMHSASLSRGDKRRLEIGMCLSQEPRLLLLDEPTAGMARADTNNTIDLLKRIKDERDITIAIIEHDMHVVFSLAERITVLAQGTPLVEDTPENIKVHPKVREAYLGESV